MKGHSSLRRRVRDDGYARIQLASLTENTVSQIGEIASFTRNRPIHELRPLSQEQSTPNTYSGRYGFEPFPLHTDFAHWRRPPRYILLRCVVGHLEVLTNLIDGRDVIHAVGETALFRSLVRPRRPLRGTLPILRLWEPEVLGTQLLRWDGEYLRAASAAGEFGINAFAFALPRVNMISIGLAETNEAIVIDNWRMLHSRSAVPPSCADRLIQRVYLETIH